MSSNSALLMMDGGTGSEGINNFKQAQLLQQIGIIAPQQTLLGQS